MLHVPKHLIFICDTASNYAFLSSMLLVLLVLPNSLLSAVSYKILNFCICSKDKEKKNGISYY